MTVHSVDAHFRLPNYSYLVVDQTRPDQTHHLLIMHYGIFKYLGNTTTQPACSASASIIGSASFVFPLNIPWCMMFIFFGPGPRSGNFSPDFPRFVWVVFGGSALGALSGLLHRGHARVETARKRYLG